MRTLSRRRAIAAALLTPLLLLGVTACSDDAKPAAGETPGVASSPDETSSPTDEPTEDQTDTVSGEGEKVDDPGQVFKDMQTAMEEARTTKVSMDTGMGTAKGSMAYGTDHPEMALTMDLGAAAGGMTSIEMRLIDGVMYMSMPPLTPAGKYFRFDSSSKTLGSLVKQFQSFSPDESTAIMAKSVKSMRDLGEENIGSDEVTHYTLVVDTAESQEMLGEDDLPDGTVPNLPETLEYDMWVTPDNLLRRIVMNLDAISMQLDYTDWGQPVNIDAPGEGDIVDAPPGL